MNILLNKTGREVDHCIVSSAQGDRSGRRHGSGTCQIIVRSLPCNYRTYHHQEEKEEEKEEVHLLRQWYVQEMQDEQTRACS
jgi:hypothetical protein